MGKLNTFVAKKRLVPKELIELTVTDIDEHSKGVAKHQGKVVFVTGAMTGEKVQAKLTAVFKNYNEAQCVKVLVAAAQRSVPECNYYSQCGGCDLQHLSYRAQLTFKSKLLEEKISKFDLVDRGKMKEIITSPIRSPSFGYRHRSRLSVKANKHLSQVGFRAKASHNIVSVVECPVLYTTLSDLLPGLHQLIAKLKQRSLIDEILLVEDSSRSIYIQLKGKRALIDADIEQLEDYVKKTKNQIECLDRSSSLVYWKSSSKQPQYSYKKEALSYKFSISDFTQINPAINELMVDQACNWMALQKSDNLIDFFCGIGNFSLPLAKKVNVLLGYELAAEMVVKAKNNALLNALSNARFEVKDLYSFQFKNASDYNKVLLDPPRAGAESLCVQLASSKVEMILYISCNQTTFFRDAKILCDQGFNLTKIGLVDMFPQTQHLEIMALFQRQN